VVLGGKPRGRRPLFGTRATRKIEFMATEEQYRDFHEVAASEGRKAAEVARDAINEYVADFRESGGMFNPTKYPPPVVSYGRRLTRRRASNHPSLF
jgi:hypothetical protein